MARPKPPETEDERAARIRMIEQQIDEEIARVAAARPRSARLAKDQKLTKLFYRRYFSAKRRQREIC
jgi:hypothetical protein